MNYKLEILDNNTSAGQIEVGQTHRFDFDGSVFYFGSIRSSRVKQITVQDDEMIVTTKNSTYTFEKDK